MFLHTSRNMTSLFVLLLNHNPRIFPITPGFDILTFCCHSYFHVFPYSFNPFFFDPQAAKTTVKFIYSMIWQTDGARTFSLISFRIFSLFFFVKCSTLLSFSSFVWAFYQIFDSGQVTKNRLFFSPSVC